MGTSLAVAIRSALSAEPTTLAAALADAYRRFDDRPALSWSGGTATYGELGAAVTTLADAYRTLGLVEGDRVVCQLPTSPEFLIAAGAAWKCGAVHVGADRDLTPTEISSLVRRLDAAVLLIDGAVLETPSALEVIRRDHPQMRVIVTNGQPLGSGCLSWSDLLSDKESAKGSADARVSPGDPAVILVTSGTTGQPKAVVRYQGQLLAQWGTMARLLGASPTDTHLVQLPLSHGFGFGLAIVGLLAGGRLVIVERFSPAATLEAVAREKVTVLHGTPTHFQLLLNHLDRSSYDLSALRTGAGSAARFPPALLRGIFEHLSMDLVHTYGCSEGLGWTTLDKDEMLRGSVGRPPPDRLRVVGPDRLPLPPGEVGEVAVRKTHRVHYWAEDVPPDRSDPDWHYMGDFGVVDDEGYLYVLGRGGQQINRGGLKVDPGEVEAVLSTHPLLSDAAVVGLPDHVLGEVVCACIVPSSPRGQPTLEQLRDFLGQSLAKHKLPERLCVVDRIPRTKIGKVDRRALASASLSLVAQPP